MSDQIADTIVMREPIIHSGITDQLPADHPLAWESVYCVKCGQMVHGIPNENMRPWVETGKGAWCLEDFTAAFAEDNDPEPWALDDGTGCA
jgi:hypothetical protein